MGWLVIIGIVVGVLVVLVLAVLAVGATLPKEHVAARRVRLPVAPDRVWPVLTDVAGYPSWRPRVARVEVLGDEPVRWRETGKDGKITFEIAEADGPRRLVTRITDPTLPFGGSWTYDLTPDEAGCVVTVTEHGEVRNLVFRFMSRFVLGHTATIDGYLTALGTKFDAAVTPETAEPAAR
jgi:uncharacterized protein YndB with AHSA1/START domain